jgi:dolichol-phosphate mannosyltransferase
MKKLSLSVVMPAYREADALRKLLKQLVPQVSKLTDSFEIIVVDSIVSLDETPEICRQYGVRHVHRMGGDAYGDAVRTGIGLSSGEFVLLMDADGSHNPTDIGRLWTERNDCDIVIGSRYVTGGHTENPIVLIGMSRILNLVYRFAFGLRVNDVSNSFRLYRGDQVRSIQLVSSDFDIVEEILIRLVFGQASASVAEIPITFEQRKAGKSKRNLPALLASYIGTIVTMRRFRHAELKKRRQGA